MSDRSRSEWDETVDNFRARARRPRRVVDVAATLDVIATLAEILTQHGPLHKDEIAQHLRDRGMDDPDSALQWNVLEMDCPARQLVDDRWVWLPTVLAGRVFTHRVSADESAHDVLTVTPDLDPITDTMRARAVPAVRRRLDRPCRARRLRR